MKWEVAQVAQGCSASLHLLCRCWVGIGCSAGLAQSGSGWLAEHEHERYRNRNPGWKMGGSTDRQTQTQDQRAKSQDVSSLLYLACVSVNAAAAAAATHIYSHLDFFFTLYLFSSSSLAPPSCPTRPPRRPVAPSSPRRPSSSRCFSTRASREREHKSCPLSLHRNVIITLSRLSATFPTVFSARQLPPSEPFALFASLHAFKSHSRMLLTQSTFLPLDARNLRNIYSTKSTQLKTCESSEPSLKPKAEHRPRSRPRPWPSFVDIFVCIHD